MARFPAAAAGEEAEVTDLGKLAKLIPSARLTTEAAAATPILDLAYDSREATPESLFFCVPGAKSNGLQYLENAVHHGAVAAVVPLNAPPDLPVPAIVVDDVRAAMAVIAAGFYGHPSRHLQLVGVTGTNGKTTTTYFIEALARAAGKATGVIGTIGSRIDQLILPGERTTPEAPDLQKILAKMRDADRGDGVTVAMEASSHALVQGRTLGCEFDVGVFTNLTQDHLDYHGTMDAYFQAKARLFTDYPASSTKPFTAVINVDDPHGVSLIRLTQGSVLTYGVESQAELHASNIVASPTALAYRLHTPEGTYDVRMPVGGLFNVSNALAALGAGRSLGFSWELMLAALSQTTGVPGRFESVPNGLGFSVIVDYAHTPDGVSNVLRAGRALHPRSICLVFGCGGDRDTTKRPLMGGLASEMADTVVVTSDNPRSEDPEAIVRDILEGIPAGAADRVHAITDRRQAIQYAIDMADEGDLIIIAGKGHETYQIFANETIHFDDREEARRALEARPQIDV